MVKKTIKQEEIVSAHKHGWLHKSVCVWILNSKNELLLQRRSPNKNVAPNILDISFGGHISSGETSLQAVAREGKEELGLDIKLESLTYMFTSTFYGETNGYIENEIHDVYLYRCDTNVNHFIFTDKEVAEVEYVYYKQVEQMWRQNNKELVIYPEQYTLLFFMLDRLVNQ